MTAFSGRMLREQELAQRKPKINKVMPILGIMLLVGLCAWFYVWTRVQVVKMNYSIAKISNIEKDLLKENEKLRLRLATLKSHSRIEFIAKNQLQLKDPLEGQVIYLK